MKYVYAWTAHPDKGGKLQKGIPRYPNGNGWKPIYGKDGKPIYVKAQYVEGYGYKVIEEEKS